VAEENRENAVLDHLTRIAEAIGDERIASEGSALSLRVIEGRFFVACVGQFKRGKSTLIDALIGTPVLPIGVVPVTAIPTVVRHGSALRARVRFSDGVWRDVDVASLDLYVSEERNPGNARGVVGAEVFAPVELLAGGMCLVDTPGLGSVFAANAAATRDFVPHVEGRASHLDAHPQ
jgi:hypothetical protein